MGLSLVPDLPSPRPHLQLVPDLPKAPPPVNPWQFKPPNPFVLAISGLVNYLMNPPPVADGLRGEHPELPNNQVPRQPVPDGGQQTVGRIPDTFTWPAPNPLLDSQWQIPQPEWPQPSQEPLKPEFVPQPIPPGASGVGSDGSVGGLDILYDIGADDGGLKIQGGFNGKWGPVVAAGYDRIVYGVRAEWVNDSYWRYKGVVRAYWRNQVTYDHVFSTPVDQPPAFTDYNFSTQIYVESLGEWMQGEIDILIGEGVAIPYYKPYVQPVPPAPPVPQPSPQEQPEIEGPQRRTEEVAGAEPAPVPQPQPLPGAEPVAGQMPEIDIGKLLEGLFPPGLQPPPQLAPERAIPFQPNTPQPIPEIGPQGLPMKIRELMNTATDIHQISQGISVNSGRIRATLGSVAKEVGRIEQKTAGMARGFDWGKIGDLIDGINDLQELIESLPGVNEWPATTWTLRGVCEATDDDPQPEYIQTIDKAKGEEAIINRLDALPGLIQAHLGFKTPICSTDDKPELEGDWVTAQWISDEASSDSPLRLRKRTRYRSKSGRSDSELADWFGSFVWEAGPVCVIHKGTWWGTPQVWARDAEEGKRVIRHLAREAGIDPDQDGKWEVSGSRNPRIGRKGTMRLRTIEGFPWVSSRNGSDMLPMG